MRILGLETTCDETAAAVVELKPGGGGLIRSNEVRSQIEEHAAFGGVVPEIAARAHVDMMDHLVRRALDDAGCKLADMDGIAAAAGPGLIGGVMVGLTTGKALALAADKPFIAVNHLEAHALTPRLTDGVSFPYCCCLCRVDIRNSSLFWVLAIIAALAQRLMMRLVKLSTKWPKCWACLIQAARKLRKPLNKVIRSVLNCRARCCAAPVLISHCLV